MKFVTNLFQGKPVSLEEGPAKYRSTNEYYVQHRDESRTNCSRFVQIVKVILCIELIILIGWLGCVSFSYYNTDRNTDCGVSGIEPKASEIDYDDIMVKNSRGSRSVGDTENGQEICEGNANATRRRLDNLAAQFVTGESSDPIVVQLRRNFTMLTIFESHQVIITNFLMESMFMGLTVDNGNNTSLFSMVPNDHWQVFMEELRQEFVNSTDSENRQRLEARGPTTEEMTSEFRAITESFYIDARYCNWLLLDSLISVLDLNRGNEIVLRSKRESEYKSPIFHVNADAFMSVVRSSILVLTGIESNLNWLVSVEEDLLQVDSSLQVDRWLIPCKQFVSNASGQLKRAFYELIRDEFRELKNANNMTFEWEDHDLEKIYRNWTERLRIRTWGETPEALLNMTIQFGKTFNLHYVKAEIEDSSLESDGLFFGILTYIDAEPEKPSVRRLKNILNGLVRDFFIVKKGLGPCQPTVGETPTRDRRLVKKRFVTSDPIPKPDTATY